MKIYHSGCHDRSIVFRYDAEVQPVAHMPRTLLFTPRQYACAPLHSTSPAVYCVPRKAGYAPAHRLFTARCRFSSGRRHALCSVHAERWHVAATRLAISAFLFPCCATCGYRGQAALKYGVFIPAQMRVGGTRAPLACGRVYASACVRRCDGRGESAPWRVLISLCWDACVRACLKAVDVTFPLQRPSCAGVLGLHSSADARVRHARARGRVHTSACVWRCDGLASWRVLISLRGDACTCMLRGSRLHVSRCVRNSPSSC